MRPFFHPRTINGPFGDPGLFISFLFEKRATLFDLGDIYSLPSRDILKISHVFVSHTHMDHFSGFDRLLRLFLGRNKDLYIYGPEGFLKNIEGKLAGYSWNLVQNYEYNLTIHAAQVGPEEIVTKTYRCRNRFAPDPETMVNTFNGTLHEEPALAVSAIILDHGIPCLGFSMKERFHVNILKDNVASLGLEIGPWLREFKEALFTGQDPDSEFEIRTGKVKTAGRSFILRELSKKIALITPGQKITYIVDVAFGKPNPDKIIEFANNSDHLYIEASFLNKDRELSEKKFHLTARQAGYIAAKANVKQYTIFHFSPRNIDCEELLLREARDEYERQKAEVKSQESGGSSQ
ncbi:MAG: ribonuclease Z [Desulfobacteraceae bacterium]|nr:MAG: ribonuclease Z [Desulfobacteraceae bacterium]